MSTAWDDAIEMAEQHANAGGIFIRLANRGDKVVGAFCGEPYAREVIWTGERYERYDENQGSHRGKRPSLRVMLNFYVPTEDTMKVIEGGTVWFKDVLKVRDKYGLDTWMFEIERHGDAGDPKTTYSILPETEIDAAMRARIDAAEHHDLAALSERGDDEDEDAVAPREAAPTVPQGRIDPRIAGALVAGLKALPRSDVDAFLAKFSVQRVRDLAAKDEGAARAFIEERQAVLSQATEVDPFA